MSLQLMSFLACFPIQITLVQLVSRLRLCLSNLYCFSLHPILAGVSFYLMSFQLVFFQIASHSIANVVLAFVLVSLSRVFLARFFLDFVFLQSFFLAVSVFLFSFRCKIMIALRAKNLNRYRFEKRVKEDKRPINFIRSEANLVHLGCKTQSENKNLYFFLFIVPILQTIEKCKKCSVVFFPQNKYFFVYDATVNLAQLFTKVTAKD